MFAKVSLRDQLKCFADFVGMPLLALRFLLPAVRLRLTSPNCFLKVCPPTLFSAVLIFFLSLTTSPISGSAKSNKSATTRFAAGTIFSRKNEIAVLPITCANAPKPRPRCRPKPLQNGIYLS